MLDNEGQQDGMWSNVAEPPVLEVFRVGGNCKGLEGSSRQSRTLHYCRAYYIDNPMRTRWMTMDEGGVWTPMGGVCGGCCAWAT